MAKAAPEKAKKKAPAFVPNVNDAEKSTNKGKGGGRESAFINARELPPNKAHWFRALPPNAKQIEAWGGAPTVPMVSWFIDTGRQDNKWLVSMSEISLNPSNTDSVADWLKNSGLEREKGFKTESDAVSQNVLAFRNCFKNKYAKGKVRLCEPNKASEFALTVVPVEKDWDDEGRSVPMGSPKFLVLGYGLNETFTNDNEEEAIGMDPACWDVGENGFDFYVMRTVKDEKTSYTMGLRKAKNKSLPVITSELVDGEQLVEEAPCLMTELESGVKSEKVIEFFADLLDYAPPAKKKKAKAQAAPDPDEEEDEDPEEVEDEDEEDEAPVVPKRRTSVKLND